MMDITELKEYNKKLNLNLGQTETNYIHTAILFAISKLFPEKFIFKGGTCLMLCYNLNRFSEDLDFTIIEPESDLDDCLTKIKLFLQNYNVSIDYKIEKKGKYEDIYVYFYGPLYKDTNNTRCKIALDFSNRKDNLLPGTPLAVNHVYREFPLFYINTLNENEIFAEKVRAIITRNKARDLFDLHFLIKKGIQADFELINKKLEIYGYKFDLNRFIETLNNKKSIWKSELSQLITNVPNFKTVSKEVIEKFKK
ncbi:MAG: nucleotidyl transferase AbiEii/AbiGii toxin family protein [archaeon]|jgi:hypothetical protein